MRRVYSSLRVCLKFGSEIVTESGSRTSARLKRKQALFATLDLESTLYSVTTIAMCH